jgi:hypothetical protein
MTRHHGNSEKKIRHREGWLSQWQRLEIGAETRHLLSPCHHGTMSQNYNAIILSRAIAATDLLVFSGAVCIPAAPCLRSLWTPQCVHPWHCILRQQQWTPTNVESSFLGPCKIVEEYEIWGIAAPRWLAYRSIRTKRYTIFRSLGYRSLITLWTWGSALSHPQVSVELRSFLVPNPLSVLLGIQYHEPARNNSARLCCQSWKLTLNHGDILPPPRI